MYKQKELGILTCTEKDTYTSFESQTIKLKVKSKIHWISVIYRLLYSQKHNHFHSLISKPSVKSSMPNRQPDNNW